MTRNPFLDADRTRNEFYSQAGRLAQRTSALRTAKVSGPPAAEVIAGLAAGSGTSTVLDAGCGRGATTACLAQAWSPRSLTAVDQSPALLADARRRTGASTGVHFVCADFHALPVPAGTVDVIVAAFCLYHANAPERAIAEFRRCLREGGIAILVTKSADSYHALDQAVAAAGLDPEALSRPSLYETFHSGNAESVAAQHLHVRRVVHHQHEFCFADAGQAAQYVATTPKYALSAHSPGLIADRLRPVLGEDGLSMSSTVSYVVAVRA